jgi:hypothetical protein
MFSSQIRLFIDSTDIFKLKFNQLNKKNPQSRNMAAC